MQTSKRKKQTRKQLDFYARTFRMRAPYQVLCDANFVHAFLKNKLGSRLEELQGLVSAALDASQVKLLLCESSLGEIEELFGKESELYVLARGMETIRCGRDEQESNGIPPQVAMRKLVGNGLNRRGYLVATQDDELKEHFRTVPGVPLLYIQRQLLLMDAPSESSVRFEATQAQNKLKVPKSERKRLEPVAPPSAKRVKRSSSHV